MEEKQELPAVQLYDLTYENIKPAMPVAHMKSGKVYLYMGHGKLEKNQDVCAIYQCAVTKQVWIRPMREFVVRFKGIKV